MNKKGIAIDIDDVLVDRVMAIQQYLNAYFDSDLDVSNMSPEDSFFDFVVAHFADKAGRIQLSEIIEDYVCGKEYMSIPPPKDTVRAIQKLAKKYELVIVSYRPKAQQAASEEWLDKYFDDNFSERLLVNTGHFGRDVLTAPKAELCRDKGLDYIIDDRLSTCVDAAKRGLHAVLFGNYPWNAPAALPKGVVRAENWRRVEEFFDV